jgi:hypothetical protein
VRKLEEREKRKEERGKRQGRGVCDPGTLPNRQSSQSPARHVRSITSANGLPLVLPFTLPCINGRYRDDEKDVVSQPRVLSLISRVKSSSQSEAQTIMDSSSYLIVGAGIFGASTALYLKKQFPSAKVILLDSQPFPNAAAASSDLNKIIRADYDDIFYMKLALEAQELWRSDPIYNPYYHESGMLFAEDMGMGSKSFKNYNALGVDHAAEMMTPEQARERFPIFKEANWDDVEENYYNARSGWGEGEPALRSLVQAAIDAGGEFVQGQVAKLSFAEDKSCIGAKLVNGNEILADRTVLCTGAHTAKLLADTDSSWAELQVGGRMIAAAAVQCQAKYDPEEEERLCKAPVHFIGMWHTHGKILFSCPLRLTNAS